MRTSAYLSTRPRYGLMDLAALLFRELWVMVAVFLAICILGVILILTTISKTYTARAGIVATVGQEYVYQPTVGTERNSTNVPQVNEIAQAEAAILNSNELKRRVIQAVGVETVLGERAAARAVSAEAAERSALRTMVRDLEVSTAPLSGVIQLSYEARDADTAAAVLNGLLDQYLIYRREVFRDRMTPALQEQREVFEDELMDADSAYEAFLRTNDIGDFNTARESLGTSYQTVFAERLGVDAQLAQVSNRLARLRVELGSVPAEIVLNQQLNVAAQDQVLLLRTERENLLARYQPDSQPVRDIEERIAQLQAFVNTGTAVGPREVQTGPNPIWVSLDTERIQLTAERDSLIGRRSVLEAQLNDLRDRQSRLTELESRNATLSADREVLTSNIREFALRESQSRAATSLAQSGADNIRIVERASPPTRGSSLRMPGMLLVILFAGFTALCVGLIRIFLRPGFTTPGSAGRTLELPVLAVAPMKAR